MRAMPKFTQHASEHGENGLFRSLFAKFKRSLREAGIEFGSAQPPSTSHESFRSIHHCAHADSRDTLARHCTNDDGRSDTPKEHEGTGESRQARHHIDERSHDENRSDDISEDASEDTERDAIKGILAHAITLNPMIKRHVFHDLDRVPDGISLGWAQLPQTKGQAFSLGMFSDGNRFAQIAVADNKGRVFLGADPAMDTHGMEPALVFGKEGATRLPRNPRLERYTGNEGVGQQARRAWHTIVEAKRRDDKQAGEDVEKQGEEQGDELCVDVIHGGIIGRDVSGRMLWLASWLKEGNRYVLEQLRADLAPSMLTDLEYRDAIAIAFFCAYLLPQTQGLLIGFGSGNIFRRLNREAPMGAIRRSVRDTLQATANGMRASGLEEYFADLMREAGALEITPGLEASHGAEPLHLYTSSFSRNYFFAWDSSLAFAPALKALKIEGNLNRFGAVSAWLERNARIGAMPIEDTVTRAQAAQIDLALLEDPALIALQFDDPRFSDLVHDDGIQAVMNMVRIARDSAAHMAKDNPDPADEGCAQGTRDTQGEWVYRQTMSTLLRKLRLPYRFDVEFRSNLLDGNAAIAFTTAGMSMMPSSRYDKHSHTWVSISDNERAAMSADYNLRVGLMMAAMSFAASERVSNVSLHIDSIGLEEAVAEQDSAITQLMSQALRAFEHMRSGDVRFGSSKADPKDGDIHGDPSKSKLVDSPTSNTDPTSRGTHDDSDSEARESAGSADSTDETLNEAFEDLMKDINLDDLDVDSMTFSVPEANGNHDQSVNDDDAEEDNGGDDSRFNTMNVHINADAGHGPAVSAPSDPGEHRDDPITLLRKNPTVRNMATVTFTRSAFFERLRRDGLRHPIDTYQCFDATMDVDKDGALRPVNAEFDLRDTRFSPRGAQEEPELSDTPISKPVAKILGADRVVDLSIQRADILQRAVNDFHDIAADTSMPSVAKAQRAMRIIDDFADPELNAYSAQVGSALIDGHDTPDFTFTLSDELDAERVKARDLLFSGQAGQALQCIEAEIGRLDTIFAKGKGVPRYFNSYAERVIYNRMFATPDERTVLIPDNLFYAHMEVSDVMAQLQGVKQALPHLNAMVSYAPAYPLSHMKLAVQLARDEDWDSARAACLNALRVALDRNDAAFAYYRLAYAEWMRDEFDIAAAAYIMSEHISPNQIAALDGEFHELLTRANAQCIPVPTDVIEAQQVLAAHDLPVWPHTEAAVIIRDAARVSVDDGMFVPARTLTVAAARMNDSENDGIDMAQAQFLRSLNT